MIRFVVDNSKFNVNLHFQVEAVSYHDWGGQADEAFRSGLVTQGQSTSDDYFSVPVDTQTDPITRLFVDVVDTNVQTEDCTLLDYTESASTQTDTYFPFDKTLY